MAKLSSREKLDRARKQLRYTNETVKRWRRRVQMAHTKYSQWLRKKDRLERRVRDLAEAQGDGNGRVRRRIVLNKEPVLPPGFGEL